MYTKRFCDMRIAQLALEDDAKCVEFSAIMQNENDTF